MFDFNQFILSSPSYPFYMGIANLTPDSFSDGNDYNTQELALKHIHHLVSTKTHIIDIGAESTKPNAVKIDAFTEISRLKKISVSEIKQNTPNKDILFSIDSYKSETAHFALNNGYDIVNDVSGLLADPNMAKLIAEYECGLIITANQTLEQAKPTSDILRDVRVNFEKSLDVAFKAGIKTQQICLDIGIGFGKTASDNIVLLRNIQHIKNLGFPVLVGGSRKSFIGKYLDIQNPKDRESASIACHYYAMKNGADIIRVHDVKAHQDFFSMLNILECNGFSNTSSSLLRHHA